ncbi:uncharacterized protein N7515_001559 [Penicillium bovifimosum]|uniref:Rhodanese domain-containing protein n=1 Tax=Penicillium bovifimosum TaxID=126998 RepID=A0A9W9L8W1_9EURO|nr:uncharacterized protein N7515_001559 [Penicillium bovifimosum]KAJ5142772.1 hypothetical protein N7515_001559 [Penicillium bovifimosum]
MASLSSTLQRSAATLCITASRTPTRTAPSAAAALRAISTPTTRGLSTTPTPKTSFLRAQQSTSLKPYSTKTPYQVQTRQNSIKASPGSLRQWGFEEITAALPTTSPNSPTHAPLILIDVREPAELTGTGIIPSAVCIPLASQPDAMYLTPDEFETRFGFPKPDPGPSAEGGEPAQMVFYCKAGVRAKAAAQMAVQAGYDPATIGVYMGSWLDWERNGGKVEKWEGADF